MNGWWFLNVHCQQIVYLSDLTFVRLATERQSGETMTSVSACHIILTPTQPAGSQVTKVRIEPMTHLREIAPSVESTPSIYCSLNVSEALVSSLIRRTQISLCEFRPRYSLVADEDVKKPTKQKSASLLRQSGFMGAVDSSTHLLSLFPSSVYLLSFSPSPGL